MQILSLISKPTIMRPEINESSCSSSDDEDLVDKNMPVRRNQVKMSFNEIRKYRNIDRKSALPETIQEEAINSDLNFSSESASSIKSKAMEAKMNVKRMASKFSPVYINSKKQSIKKAPKSKSMSRQIKYVKYYLQIIYIEALNISLLA